MSATQTCTATPAGDGQPLTLVCTTAQPVSYREVGFDAALGAVGAITFLAAATVGFWTALYVSARLTKHIFKLAKARFFGAGA